MTYSLVLIVGDDMMYWLSLDFILWISLLVVPVLHGVASCIVVVE